jgi:predicted DNA-binding transcriptional regulator YafY
MFRDLQRYLSFTPLVEIIYIDRLGQISQRRIKLHSINNEQIKAYCFARRSIRSFFINNILAISPVIIKKGA